MRKNSGQRASFSWEKHVVHKFCDLCIREIERGNRPGKNITRDGWNNIANDFDDGMGREYQKQQFKYKWDMLKKEWKQYKQLFENDPDIKRRSTEDTINAPDSWWEEKLKVFPEAKKFRNHGIEPKLEDKLDKMFTVIGDLEEYASLPSDAEEFDEPRPRKRRKSVVNPQNIPLKVEDPDTPTLYEEPGKKRKKSKMRKNSGQRASFSWEKHVVHKFCDLCIREIERGNRPGKNITRDGWNNIVNDFDDGTGREYQKQQLKYKWDMLKKEWKQYKQLLENDPDIKLRSTEDTIDAPDSWWEEKLKVFPEAKKFRNHGIEPELEDKLDKMFTVIGDLEEYASLPSDAEEFDEPRPPKKRKSVVNPQNIPLKVEDPDTPTLYEEPCKKRKKSEEKPSTAKSANQCESCNCTITEAIRLLDSIEDVPKASSLYYFAFKLILDRDKREVFIALSPETKVWWLKMEELESRN